MKADTLLTGEAIRKVVDYLWVDEMRSFEEEYEVEIQSQDSIEEWIKACEERWGTDHIFYWLMILKSEYEELWQPGTDSGEALQD